MEFTDIKAVMEKIAEENYKGFVQALVSIDTGINDMVILDMLYDTYMDNSEGSLFSMWLYVEKD